MKSKRYSFSKIDKSKKKESLKPLFKRQALVIGLSVFLILVITLATSVAIFTKTGEGSEYNVVQVGDLELSYVDLNDEGNVLELADSYPLSDSEGEASTPYRFSVENTGTIIANYTVKVVEDTDTINADGCSDNLLDYSYLRYKFDNETSGNLKDKIDASNEYVVGNGTLEPGESNIHEIRLWINESSPNSVLGTHYHGKVVIDVEQDNTTNPNERYYADNSGAEIPRLTSGMIPVYYDESAKTWKKADLYKEWYDYEKWNWANAVTVTKETRESYMEADSNTPISMDDINTMWVWIPRYEYQYTDLGTIYAGGTQAQPGEIKVNFISRNTTTSSDISKYRIPEGFTFGTEEIPGFWMGKFETSTLESCTAANDVNDGCDLTTLTPQIIPNKISWRGARISTFFQVSRLMQSSDNASIYGFAIDGTTTMDTHMIKNTEWGIVAMLSQSKYGKYGNSSYFGANKEVYQNKSTSFITGSSNGTPSQLSTNTQVVYDTPNTGYGASTTGTIYGVYDMVGGAFEYVMGSYNHYSGSLVSQNSGFCGTNGPAEDCREWPNSKYYNLYESNIASSSYKIGDATYETSSWYNDEATFVYDKHPWFYRGGLQDNSIADGVFYFSYFSGSSIDLLTSRFVVKP